VPTPLRAFLMLRADAGEWTVQVFHDLEGLVRAWEQRAAAVLSGVVHVGFNRSPARAFEQVSDGFPGQMLITAAAKYALPSGFHTSSRAVGEIEGVPIFLGTAGWGYDAPEPEVSEEPSPSEEFRGWVADFVSDQPDAVEVLAETGIFDEETYLEAEVSLSAGLRQAVGAYRYRHLIGSSGEDPCAIARASPPWLRCRLFADLPTTVRVSNVFQREGVETVEDLAGLTLPEMFRMANFGRKSVVDLVHTLERGLAVGPAEAETEAKAQAAEVLTLLDALRQSLQACSPREHDILARRMGLSQRAQTLAEIGEVYGVTRERIRQLEAKAVQRLVRREQWDDLLTRKLKGLLSGREYPLPLLGVEAVDGWFAGVAEESSAVRYILANMCTSGAALVRVDGIEYFALISQGRWESLVAEARRLLMAGVEERWTEERCRVLVRSVLPPTAREFDGLLWEKATALCHFGGAADGNIVLKGYGRGAEQFVQAALDASDRPLHYTEIAERVSQREGRPIEVRRAHSAAAEVGYLLGRGIYGTDRHLPLGPEDVERLAEAAEDIITNAGSERQWHASEIVAALIDEGFDLLEGVTQYVVDVALKKRGMLRSLGRLVWTLPIGEEGETCRIDIRQAIIATVQAAGRPLPAEEIRQRLVAVRGVSESFQIFAHDPLVRVGKGLWGLNDRDLAVKRADQPMLLDALAAELRRQGRGLHASELENFEGAGLLGQTILSLAPADTRFRVSPGQYLYLAEWSTPRRESISEALFAILAGAAQGVPFDDVVRRVELSIGRTCDRKAVSVALQAIDANIDAAGRWRLRVAPRDTLSPEEASAAG
jgi:Sigma-70, region 4/Bacterial RNA polymerase, alpha chain C terminal domain